MYSVTLTGLIIIALVMFAAVGGWATSGVTRLGHGLGFAVGLGAGLVVALLLVAHVSGWAGVLVLLVGSMIGGGMLGAAVLGGVGYEIARGLHQVRLGSLDRLLGAALSGIGAVVVCALVLSVLALVDPVGSVTRAARHDAVAHWLMHSLAVARL